MSTSDQNIQRTNENGAAPRRSAGPRRKRRKRSTGATVAVRFFQVLGTLLLIMIVTGCFVACYAVFYINTVIIPSAGLDLSKYTLNESSVIYYTDAETGQAVELTTLSGTENREWIDYEDIPEYFINAAVAIEDKRFFTHKGVDWGRTVKGILCMFTGQDIQGGSTITQQLIKNLTGQDEVTVKRKIGEIFNALEFEKDHEKDEIITWYLNKINLGKGNYGIVTAAKYYFGKEVSEITLAEAASIIAITNNPSIYGPASNVIVETSTGEEWTSKQWNKYRQELILDAMLEQEMISQEEHDEAVAQELNFVFDDEEAAVSSVFSWYVEQVISEVRDYLVEEQHMDSELAFDIIYGGGLAIYTAYDPDVQAAVDAVYSDTANLDYTSSDGQQMQSAITVVDNETGYVVALAGKIGEKTGNRQMNYASGSTRQPGSSIKPLASYSPAIEFGLITPATIIDDSPYQELDGSAWPRNDNGRYKGLTSVLAGITSSTNTIATKILADYVTPEASFQFLTERYGLTTLVDSVEINGKVKTDIGVAALAMGGLTYGVNTYEMAAAYATFPRAGAYTEPTVVLKVETKDGELIWDNTPETDYVIKESTAWYMNTLLKSAVTGTGNAARFNGMTIAGKTGTTTDNYDRWFAGYTPYYTAVVWTGYPTPAKMRTSVNPAAALWKQVMSRVHEDLENRDFFSLGDTESVAICLDCGMRADENCQNDIRTVLEGTSRVQTFTFAKGDAPTAYCTCHVPVTICKDDPILNTDGTPTGAYRLATEFCPEESVLQVCIVSYERTEVGSSVWVEDKPYMMSFYEGLESPDCTVHTTYQGGHDWSDFDWDSFNPYDLSTWPFDPYSDPSTWPFDPYDSSTWPVMPSQPGGGGAGGTDEPTQPSDEPTAIPTTPVDPGPSDPVTEPPQPTDDPGGPSLGVDYIPAGSN